jgi:DNA-binding transcriptional regulator YiaG
MIDATTAAHIAKRQMDQAEADLAEAIRLMRDDEGLSWADVAAVLGTTRQSAWRKYGTGLDDFPSTRTP